MECDTLICNTLDVPAMGWLAPSPIDVDCIQPIVNTYHEKPLGGLWLSPLRGATTEWDQWREQADYGSGVGLNFQRVSLHEDARIVRIDGWDDFAQLLSAYALIHPAFEASTYLVSLDFERMAQDIDALYVTEAGIAATRFPLEPGPCLYSWDLESMLVFNAQCLSEVSTAVQV